MFKDGPHSALHSELMVGRGGRQAPMTAGSGPATPVEGSAGSRRGGWCLSPTPTSYSGTLGSLVLLLIHCPHK